MAGWASPTIDLLWRNGLTAIPLVLLTAAACRWIPSRPATRHTMWLVVLAWLVTPPLLPEPPMPELVSAWVTPLLSPDLEASNGLALSEPGAEATGPVPARPLEVLHDETFGPSQPLRNPTPTALESSSPRKQNKNASQNPSAPRASARAESRNPVFGVPLKRTLPEPDNQSATAVPISSPLPSPRMAARTASRSPDVLAQATGAVGPLSEANKTSGAAKIPVDVVSVEPGGEALAPARLVETLFISRDGHDSTPTPTLSVEGRGESKQGRDEPQVESARVAEVEPTSPLVFRTPDWRMWTVGLTAVRDAVTALPPLPAVVWMGGTLFLVLVAGLRVLRFRRRLSQALPAPGSVTRVVEAACRKIGLRGVPETLMIDERLSPMIWCGPRPRLILPAPLWSQLDDPGRRAVVFHELAHVRRCDHWVSWADAIIGSLYWWHPLVWWARRRLHAEAEVCCDAWVTSLLPRTRRAYAEALLVTRQYVADENEPVPALGIGVTTGRARRFARRLTMVMTESVKPKLSASGLALVLMMAATGWLASPAQSYPNDDKAAKAEGKPCEKPCATPCAKATAAAVAAPGAAASASATPAPPAELGGTTTYEQHMANRKHEGSDETPESGFVVQPGRVLPGIAVSRFAPFALAAGHRGGDQEERLNRLEEELARLEAQLERLSDSLENRHEGDDPGEHTPRPPRVPRAPRNPHPAQPPMPPMSPMPPMPPMPPQPPMPPGAGVGSGPGASNEGGEVFARSYPLPQGKLEALTQLMSRSDVPILVRRQENALEVNATERQHRIFAAFIRMIDPSAERRGDGDPPGDGYRVGYMKIEQKRMAKEIEKAVKQRTKAIERLEKRRAKTGARMDEVKNKAMAKAETQEALEQEAENLNELAEKLAEQAEEIRERSERIDERAGRESERDKRADLEREALMLRHQAEAIELQKNQLEDRAHAIEDRAREAEDQAREAENRLEQLEEELRQAEQEATDEDNDDDGSHASVDNSGGNWWSALQPALEAAMESLSGQPSENSAAEQPLAPQPDME